MWLIWIVLIVVLVLVLRAVIPPGTRPDGGRSDKTAREILDERYARGEIDKDEYEQKRRDLGA
jgi:putative membrane protein